MKTIVYIGTSLDGFIARKDGEIDWLVQFANDEAIRAYEELISRIDAIVIGRGTFEKVLTFPSWPYEKKVFVLSNSAQIFRLPELELVSAMDGVDCLLPYLSTEPPPRRPISRETLLEILVADLGNSGFKSPYLIVCAGLI